MVTVTPRDNYNAISTLEPITMNGKESKTVEFRERCTGIIAPGKNIELICNFWDSQAFSRNSADPFTILYMLCMSVIIQRLLTRILTGLACRANVKIVRYIKQ